jgi:MYXO-CTERM domain-containing protein
MPIRPALIAVAALCLPAMARPVSAQPLPEGDTGIAVRYPDDQGIGEDPDVVFTENFESVSGSSLTFSDTWNNVWGLLEITTAAGDVHAGAQAIKVTATEPERSQGAMHDFGSGALDELFVRYYLKYHPDFPGMHHTGIDIFAGAPGIGQGESTGVHPDGTDSFQALLDTLSPMFDWGPPGNVPPGLLEVYCYHMDQLDVYGDIFYSTGEGNGNLALFGDDFVPRPNVTPERGRWYSFEVMLKANTPGSRDGRVAFWVDGALAGDFPNLRFRSVDELRINQVIITTYVSELGDNQTVWYDDIVAARSYIGPMVPAGGPEPDDGAPDDVTEPHDPAPDAVTEPVDSEPDGSTGDAGHDIAGDDDGDGPAGDGEGCGCSLAGNGEAPSLSLALLLAAAFISIGRRRRRDGRLFAVLCLAALAACGGGGEADTDADATEDFPEPDAGDAADPDAAEDPVEDADGLDDFEPDADMDVEPDGEVPSDDVIRTPDLEPITADEAGRLLSFVRRIKTEASGSTEVPVAWSFVNWNCQERALVLQYAIATADPALAGDPETMREADLTDERVMEIAENPSFDVAALNITGPLAAEQVFIRPDMSEVEGPPYGVFWTYHHTAAVNVDGEIMAVDLSIGDDPIPIDEWSRSFVPAGIECFHMSSDEWWTVWVYWNSLVSGFEPPPEPERVCGYTITPMFTTKWDQDIQFDQIRWSPETMETQLGGFKTVLQTDYGYVPSDAEIPFITSRYTAKTLADVCTWNDFPFCDDL